MRWMQLFLVHFSSRAGVYSAKRIIVDDPIAAEFVERFVKRVKNLKVGDPRQPDTDIGPLTTKAQLEKPHAQVQDALDKGATFQCGDTV